MCQEKQTLKQVFFRGSGKDCRLQAQQRNMNKRTQNTQNEEFLLSKRGNFVLRSNWILSLFLTTLTNLQSLGESSSLDNSIL